MHKPLITTQVVYGMGWDGLVWDGSGTRPLTINGGRQGRITAGGFAVLHHNLLPLVQRQLS